MPTASTPEPGPSRRAPETSEPAAGGDQDATPLLDDDHAPMWELVQASQAGSQDAFGQIYNHYLDSVFRFIYYRVGDRTIAEDLTSDTFFRAMRAITSVSYQGRDIGAWLITIARNIVLDHAKSARYRWEIATPEFAEQGRSLDSAEVTVLSQLTNERLLQAVSELSVEQQECIVLRFINGHSVAETAEIMGKNDGSVKALQHRAVRRLADVVAEELK